MGGVRLSLVSCLIVSLLAIDAVPAQASPTFADDTPLELKLSAAFRELGRNPDDRPEVPAVIEFAGADGAPAALDIEIRIRGNSRVRECQYPPLSLDFPRSDTTGTVFEGQNRLKLAVLCRSASTYSGYLAQEFLIYRMLNQLTDRSFRVRWATVEYVDTGARRPEPRVAPAFLIEAEWELAERLGMEVVETDVIESDAHDPSHLALLTGFQYLIGNTDWSLFDGPPDEPCCHNGKVFRNSEGTVYVVPYDFDNSGLIDAEYAVPSENLRIRSVTQRLYRGLCRWNEQMPAAFAELNRQRGNLLGVFDSDIIDQRPRERALDWLADSFEIINDPDDLERQIYGRCRD